LKTLLLSKNPFYKPEQGNKSCCYLAGYTVGLVAPLGEHLLQRDNDLAFLSPNTSNIDPRYYQYFPKELTSDRFSNFSLNPVRLPKVPYIFPELETKAAIMTLGMLLKGIDIAISVYTFPWIVPIADLGDLIDYKIATFTRGSDLFYGCDPNSARAKHRHSNI